MRIKIFILLGLLAPTVLMASACNFASSVFFVQTSEQAILKPGYLILKNPDPRILCFADAPSTAASVQSLSKYMLTWTAQTGSFEKTNPNAALVGFIVNKKSHKEERLSAVLVLKHAHYDAVSNTLTYDVSKSFLVPKAKLAHQANLVHPTLFIDPNIAPAGLGSL
jgi:hypothetical protein